MFLSFFLNILAKTLSHLHKPQLSGRITLSGPSSPCHIITNEDGSIHIKASEERILWYGQGFVMARDRLWQMEWMRRIATGTLAEIVPDAELSDRIARTLGFHRQTLNLEQVDPDEVEYLQAFVDGINDYLKECFEYSKPTEAILFAMPKPTFWTLKDVVTLMRLLSFQMSKNPLVKILNIVIAKSLLPEQLVEKNASGNTVFMKQRGTNGAAATAQESQQDDAPKTLPECLASIHSDSFIDVNGHIDWERLELLSQQFASNPLDQGSSAFVINGDHTKSGKPILACDIWSTTSAPSMWFKCQLTLKKDLTSATLDNLSELAEHRSDFEATGFSLVGLPYLMVGQNQHLTWAMTPSHFADNTDLFVEYIDVSDNTRFRLNGRWQYATPLDEVIAIKGQKTPVVEKVRITSHGPIIPGIFKSTHLGATSKREISIASPSLEEWSDIPIAGFRRIQHARNLEEFKEATEYIDVFPIVLTYADTMNNTGWIFTGDVPARPPHSEENCHFPVGGASGENEWLPHNFVNISNQRMQRFYPPVEGSLIEGSPGRSFIVGTHSLPDTKQKLPSSQRSSRTDIDDEERSTVSAAVEEKDVNYSFLGHPFKYPTRSASIRAQILKKMAVNEQDLPPHLSKVAQNHEWTMQQCHELKDILTRMHGTDQLDILQNSLPSNGYKLPQSPSPASPLSPNNNNSEFPVQPVLRSGSDSSRLLLKNARKLTMQDAIGIQSMPWMEPNRLQALLRPLLGQIRLSEEELHTFLSEHNSSMDVSLNHIKATKKQMLAWNGSLEWENSGALLIQVFFHELVDLILSPKLDNIDKSIHHNSLSTTHEHTESEPSQSNNGQNSAKEHGHTRCVKMLFKFGLLDTLSPLSLSGAPEPFLELLLKRFPPNIDTLTNALIHTIHTMRHLCSKSKSDDAEHEVNRYKLSDTYHIQWRHYIDHKITSGFELRGSQRNGCGLFNLDNESCTLHGGTMHDNGQSAGSSNQKRTHHSSYLGFQPNIPSKLYTLHCASAVRMVVDLDDLDNSVCMFAPGNSGHVGSDHYSDWTEGYSKQEYQYLKPTGKERRLTIVPLRQVISSETNASSPYEVVTKNPMQRTDSMRTSDKTLGAGDSPVMRNQNTTAENGQDKRRSLMSA